jgi:hypothetical protein
MQSLRRRIEALEKVLLRPRYSGAYSAIVSKVMRSLSDDELDRLEKAQDAVEQGRALTPPESSILQSFNIALEAECQRAGFASLRECRQAIGCDCIK